MIRPLVLLAVAAGLCIARPAHAETTLCTNITSLPAVLSSQGVYCLKQNLETAITSGAAITISANNVTLDCNDWKVGGLQAGASTSAVGILANNRVNLTVRHCGVRGFRTGISLTGDSSAGHLVEDNRLDFNTYVGMEVFGDGDIVRRNRVVDTGGATGSTLTQAVRIGGFGTLVADNIVNGVTVAGSGQSGTVIAFNIFGNNHEFDRNLVTGLVPVSGGTSRALYGAGFGSYRDNTVVGSGLASSTGLDGGATTSMCSGNRVRGFATALVNCVSVAGNYAN